MFFEKNFKLPQSSLRAEWRPILAFVILVFFLSFLVHCEYVEDAIFRGDFWWREGVRAADRGN